MTTKKSKKRAAASRDDRATGRKEQPAAGKRPATAPPAPEAAATATSRRYHIALVAAMAIFVIVLSLLSIQKHRGYQGGRYDTGIMTQTVYNTAHGRFLEATTAEGKQQSRLGSHVDPIIALFAIPWRVWPDPEMLLVGQALIVALAAWPAFRLGRHILRDERAAFMLSVALLMYPPLQFAVLNEFHPVTLAIPFLLFAFVFLEEDRRWAALPFLVLAALCKEEVPLVIACMGAYFALRKRALWPLAITALATAYFLIAVGVVIPHYSTHTSGGTPFVDRYADYGDSAGEVATNVFLKPGTTAGDLFGASNLKYWLELLWPFAFASLLSPLTLLIAAPEFLLNALAGREFQRMITFHYVAAEIPFIFAAAVLGLARLRAWLERRAGEAGGSCPSRRSPRSSWSRASSPTTRWDRCRSRCRGRSTRAPSIGRAHMPKCSTRRWR